MRPLWKGAISFGLVTIPVSLYPATRTEELKFRMLRKSDHSPIIYKRVAEADGKCLGENCERVRCEKGKYVILKGGLRPS
jgi:DNA end-binding protein Ku